MYLKMYLNKVLLAGKRNNSTSKDITMKVSLPGSSGRSAGDSFEQTIIMTRRERS
jgi:hypothetical protein